MTRTILIHAVKVTLDNYHWPTRCSCSGHHNFIISRKGGAKNYGNPN